MGYHIEYAKTGRRWEAIASKPSFICGSPAQRTSRRCSCRCPPPSPHYTHACSKCTACKEPIEKARPDSCRLRFAWPFLSLPLLPCSHSRARRRAGPRRACGPAHTCRHGTPLLPSRASHAGTNRMSCAKGWTWRLASTPASSGGTCKRSGQQPGGGSAGGRAAQAPAAGTPHTHARERAAQPAAPPCLAGARWRSLQPHGLREGAPPRLPAPPAACRRGCVTARVAANIGEPESMEGFDQLDEDDQASTLLPLNTFSRAASHLPHTTQPQPAI